MTDRTAANPPLERLSINLIPRAARALEQVMDLTELSKTDVINRALQLYAFIEQTMRDGGAVFVQGAGKSESQQIKIF